MKIKLMVCCHQNVTVPAHSLLFPVQVGAALEQEKFLGFYPDDVGENISEKNRSYCELTALYWAWKNLDADYYGLFHYRRYLYPGEKTKKPYRICGAPTETLLNDLGYQKFSKMIQGYDMIMPVGEQMYVSVRQHYAQAPYHHSADLDIVEEIIRERYPDMIDALESYFGGTVHYFGNIVIMSRQVYGDYCAWLFDILEEYDRRGNVSGYSKQELRVNGYLAERLLGVYYTDAKLRSVLKTAELPRVHFVPDDVSRRKQKLALALLPPGSRVRAFVKAVKMRLKR